MTQKQFKQRYKITRLTNGGIVTESKQSGYFTRFANIEQMNGYYKITFKKIQAMIPNTRYFYGQNTENTKVVTFEYAGFSMSGKYAFYITSELNQIPQMYYAGMAWIKNNLRFAE